MNDANIKRYEDGEYFENNPDWHMKHSPWKANHVLRMLAKNKLNPQKICEIGCGAGEILNQLYLKMPGNVEFIGYDISPQAVELCKAKEKDRLTYFTSDFFASEIDCDLVLVIDVVEHIEDYFAFLRKIKTKGIYKIFHFPLDMSVQTVLRATPLTFARKKVGHLHYFSKETALESLKDTGYNIIDYFYTSGMTELPARGLKTRILNIPRRILFWINQDLSVRILGGYSLLILAK